MAYEFKKLSEVESLSEAPEGASLIAEIGGEIKRIPSNGLGSGGSTTPIVFKLSNDKYLQNKDTNDIATAEEIVDAYMSGNAYVINNSYNCPEKIIGFTLSNEKFMPMAMEIVSGIMYKYETTDSYASFIAAFNKYQ